MKLFIAWMTAASISTSAWAQTASVKDIPTDGDTTISISKGKKAQDEYEITEGSDDIPGEPEILEKEARSSWDAKCVKWKKEFRENNKENVVISMNCNTPNCSKNSNSQTVCTSKATYKVKTKIR
jgi:hypothetical protein